MDITFSNQGIKDVAADALVVGVAYQQTGQRTPVFARVAQTLDEAFDGLLKQLLRAASSKARQAI